MVQAINATLGGAANASLGAANATSSNATGVGAGIDYVTGNLIPTLAERFVDLVKAPAVNHEMLWIVLPLLAVLFAAEFYFGRYTREELGWNTAVVNSVVLVFVAVDLFRYMHREGVLHTGLGNYSFSPEMLVAIIILLEGVALFFADFFHFLPKKVAFLISSELPVNLTGYVGIAIVYSGIPFDLMTILAAIILFFVLLLFFHLVHFLEPHSYET